MGIKDTMNSINDQRLIKRIRRGVREEVAAKLITKLKLDDSRMEIFELFRTSGVYKDFERGKKMKIWDVRHPYFILEEMQETDNRTKIFEYIREKGNIAKFYKAYKAYEEDVRRASSEYSKGQEGISISGFFDFAQTKKDREKLLDEVYNVVNEKDPEILSIMKDMKPETRKKFIEKHKIPKSILLTLYVETNDLGIIESQKDRLSEYMEEYGTDEYATYPSLDVTPEQAETLLTAFGKNMSKNATVELIGGLESPDKIEEFIDKINKADTKRKIRNSLDVSKLIDNAKDLGKRGVVVNARNSIDGKRKNGNRLDGYAISGLIRNIKDLGKREELIDKYIKRFNSGDIADCLDHGFNNPMEMKRVINKYYDRLEKDDISDIFQKKMSYQSSFISNPQNREMIEMFLTEFPNDLTEESIKNSVEAYNDIVKFSEDRINDKQRQEKAKNDEEYRKDYEEDRKFLADNEANPRYTYHVVDKYYSARTKDNKFKSKLFSDVIAKLDPEDRIELAREYRGKIKGIELRGMHEYIKESGEDIEIKGFLREFQGIMPRRDIVAIIRGVPKDREQLELAKICELSTNELKAVRGEKGSFLLDLASTNKPKGKKANRRNMSGRNRDIRDDGEQK